MSHPVSPDHAAGRAERVALRDGGHVLIRPLSEHDRPSVVALLTGLSPESRANRFHSAGLHITPAILDLVTAGHVLVATYDHRIVALASYQPRQDPTVAETAIVVADAAQRHGIGTALCQRLLRDARRTGIRRLRAEVLASNYGMRALLRNLGVRMTYAYAFGEITVEVDLVTGQRELPECDDMRAA